MEGIMKYGSFIKGGPLVSKIGFGAWQLGVNSGWKDMSEKKAIALVHSSLEYGVNFFDTAPNYGNGTSEIRLGKALKGADRDKIVVNTKFGHTVSGGLDFRSDSIRESLDGSLQRLQVDYVDSLIIHNPPYQYLDGNKNAHYEVLERLKEEGKIKAYGASLDTYKEMKLLMETTSCGVIEAFFNILHQDTARAFEMARKKNIGIIAKIPLDSGWLSGKYHEWSTFDDIRKRWSEKDIKIRASLVNRIKRMLEKDHNLPQIAISFCLAYEAISTVIPGNRTLAQLKENIESIRHPVSKELVEKLETFYHNEVKELNLPW